MFTFCRLSINEKAACEGYVGGGAVNSAGVLQQLGKLTVFGLE